MSDLRLCWKLLGAGLLALASFVPVVAQAQHSDIQLGVEGDKIVVQANGDAPVWTSVLFAPGFPPAPGDPPVQQDDPGFNAPNGSFSPGSLVGLSVVQPLWYWDGQMLSTPPTGTVLGLENVLGDFLFVDTSNLPDPSVLDFALAGDEGGIHQHVVYHLPDPVSPDGAYGLVLEVTAADLMPSDPFLVVLNQRLPQEEFDLGVQAMLEAAGLLEPELLAGDYNGNGLVEQADLDLVLSNWGADGAMPPGLWVHDLPKGLIDQEELDGVLANWGKSTSTMSRSSGIPEPATLLLGIFLCAGAAGKRAASRLTGP